MKRLLPILLVLLTLTACKQAKQVESADDTPQLVGPTFSGDTALALCGDQCAFGPRVMNSTAHDKCEQWIINKFKQYGCDVRTQKADLTGWDGKTLHSTNIIASINPKAEQRIVICAHWDCRPWADNDPDSTNWHKPVMAANDAASGVAVMLELARIINGKNSNNTNKVTTTTTINKTSTTTTTTVGSNTTTTTEVDSSATTTTDTASLTLPYAIDLVCFDAEDYGSPQWSSNEDENSWALGAQYYAQHLSDLYPDGTAPTEGILLDMVGGQGAHFYQEGFSMQYASTEVQNVWAAAASAGYGSTFVNQQGGTVTDDHKPLNEAGIPTIDIISFFPDCEASSFGPTWHTVSDDMQHLDKDVLKAVGQSLVQYLYTR